MRYLEIMIRSYADQWSPDACKEIDLHKITELHNAGKLKTLTSDLRKKDKMSEDQKQRHAQI